MESLFPTHISLKREGETTLFGTDRTFTFIGILGYLLYILDPVDYRLFMGGGAILGLLLGLNYYVKQSQFHVFGVTTIIIALITYCIAPIVATQPSWFYVMVVVTVLLFTELKHTFTELAHSLFFFLTAMHNLFLTLSHNVFLVLKFN